MDVPGLMSRRKLLVLLGALAPTLARAAGSELDAPNVVEISPTLVTSGQPTAKGLQSLGALGFQAVIYLAPSTVPNAIHAEPELLAKQGIEFIHIPIEFAAPSKSHFDAFSAAMARLGPRKVLVHCEINMRASSLVFLYRVIHLREPADIAYESVARVWSPRGPWRRLIVEQLATSQVQFEPH